MAFEASIESPLGQVAVWRCEPAPVEPDGAGPEGAPPAGEGAGTVRAPVLYLHSAAGESGPMISVFMEALAVGGRETVAPMMPGFAGSEGINEVEDMEDLVFHLLDLLQLLGLEDERRPHVVGLSLGGWLAAELACRYSERVRSITLVNPAGLYIEGASIGEIFGQPLDELAEKVFASQDHPVAQMMRQMGETLRNDPAAIPFDLLRPYMEAQAAAAKLAWNPYLYNPRLRGRLHRVTAPALVVAADSDRLIPSAHAEAYAGAIAGARLARVPGGHMLSLENPGGLAEVVLGHAAAVEGNLTRT